MKVKRNDRVRLVNMKAESDRANGAEQSRKYRCVNGIELGHFLILGAILFAISVVGIFMNRKNIIVLLMAIELMLLAAEYEFRVFLTYLGDTAGQIFVFFIPTVAAAESAMVWRFWSMMFRNLDTINVEDLDVL